MAESRLVFTWMESTPRHLADEVEPDELLTRLRREHIHGSHRPGLTLSALVLQACLIGEAPLVSGSRADDLAGQLIVLVKRGRPAANEQRAE